MYENIVDEAVYIARASEGAMSVEWVMNQPVFIRKKYFKQMQEEVAKREERMNKKRSPNKGGPSYAKNSRSVNLNDIVTQNT